MAVFGTVIREVYGSLVSSFYLSYVCQGSACDDGYCSIEKPVLEWSTTRSAKCVAYGTTLSAENQHQVMSRSADALAAGDVGDNNVGAFVEMYFTADKDISNTAEECSAILDARMLLARMHSLFFLSKPLCFPCFHLHHSQTHEATLHPSLWTCTTLCTDLRQTYVMHNFKLHSFHTHTTALLDGHLQPVAERC